MSQKNKAKGLQHHSENLSQQPNSAQSPAIVLQSQSFKGPIPAPSILEQYNKIVPIKNYNLSCNTHPFFCSRLILKEFLLT